MKIVQKILLTLFLGIILFANQGVSANGIDYTALNLLTPTGEKQMILGDYDSLGRATSAHIQLQDKDEPVKKKEPRIKFNPVGWHNYKFSYGSEGKKSYLFNRGHLIGYQFSGLSNEGKNLVPLTAWTNSGNYKGMDASNIEGMLYYENNLDSWLATHRHYWLDYKVTPIYMGDELLPRQLVLQYVGLDDKGNLLQIQFGSAKEIVDSYGITTVVLDNYSINATIDYMRGTATPSLLPTETTVEVETMTSSIVESTTSVAETTASVVPEATIQADNSALAPVVYIARNGSADVYWYSKDNMPANTNFSRVIEMSEQDALNIGKRHTTKE